MKSVKLQDICLIEKGKQIDTNQLLSKNTYKYINGGIKESGYYTEFNKSNSRTCKLYTMTKWYLFQTCKSGSLKINQFNPSHQLTKGENYHNYIHRYR